MERNKTRFSSKIMWKYNWNIWIRTYFFATKTPRL